MTKQMKPQLLESLMMVERTQQLQSAAVNTKGASAKPSTQLANSGHIKPSTTNLPQTSSNLTENEKDNALKAALILASTVPTLVRAGMIRKARHKETKEILLVFPSTVWTDDLKVK